MSRIQALHSRYNPQGEAQRYLDSLALEDDVGVFILIEPGMGYLTGALRKRFPYSRIIALHAEAPGEIPRENRSDAFWFPGQGKSPREFLEQEIPDSEAAAVKVIEWRPALGVYKEAYRFLLAETAEFLKQADASARTLRHFGRRWFRNFFRNLGFLSKLLCPVPFSFPVVITGAGPSLEETIPLIRRESQNLLVLAVSSSAAALKCGGLEPDLVIATDGGGWALLHLYECFRGENRPREPRFAVSLSAALPSQCEDAALLLISDGSLWQELILRKLGLPFISLPQRGTVSAAALDLAFALTQGPVFFTGIDLSHKGIQTHAKPYSFDRLWEEKASRLCPSYSQVFARSGLIRAGGSHDIYASWFSRQLAAYPQRLYSLGSNNEVFRALETSSLENLKTGITKPVWKSVLPVFDESPAKQGAAFLSAALKDPRYGAKLAEELGPMLFPGSKPGEKPSPKELAEAVRSLTRSFRGSRG